MYGRWRQHCRREEPHDALGPVSRGPRVPCYSLGPARNPKAGARGTREAGGLHRVHTFPRVILIGLAAMLGVEHAHPLIALCDVGHERNPLLCLRYTNRWRRLTMTTIRSTRLGVLLSIAVFAGLGSTGAQAYDPIVRDHRTPRPVVRDHRTSGPFVPDNWTPGPIVRDHRTPGPIVRDHRTSGPFVPDNWTPGPIVRDHRTPGPIVRDHRTSGPFVPDNWTP